MSTLPRCPNGVRAKKRRGRLGCRAIKATIWEVEEDHSRLRALEGVGTAI